MYIVVYWNSDIQDYTYSPHSPFYGKAWTSREDARLFMTELMCSGDLTPNHNYTVVGLCVLKSARTEFSVLGDK